MDFEFDLDKSHANRQKHGIDFIDAQKLWGDDNFVEVPARTEDELRWLIIGRINTVYYSAVITYRGERIRLISVRRARDEEIIIYES